MGLTQYPQILLLYTINYKHLTLKQTLTDSFDNNNITITTTTTINNNINNV